jgi:uncharacterized protein (DUF1810 family)
VSDLGRFVTAQAPVIDAVRAELAAGRKRTHWMWFVFPQLAGLGHSLMAQRYAIGSLEEAKAYLAHPVLGARLRECTALLLAQPDDDIHRVMGSPDDRKLQSCMTLFEAAASDPGIFSRCLQRFYAGRRDDRTLDKLGSDPD